VKILDKYLLKSFLITFTTVFVILFFIFILQTVWLFISELAGKDLDFLLVVKFLLFSMPRIVPLVLPLSVLLASIMTFGSLAENYEFAAMKSSGISFQRTMRSITVFIILLSILSFFFANNVIPYAEYKFINFRRNIAQVKPAMAIAEGQFSEVGNYTIKVDKKSGEKGNFLTGVTIHRKLPNGEGNTTVIKAKKGELISSESSNTLKLVLTDGNYYEDIIPKKYEERPRIPFAKGTFKRDVINIDLSKLNQSSMDEVDISNTNTMLNISELRFTIDSLNTNYKKDLRSYTENIYLRTGINNTYYQPDSTQVRTKVSSNNLLANLTDSQKSEVVKIAFSNIENTVFSIDSSIFEMQAKQKSINKHWIALHDKYMIAFSCLLMFFIGAPLGSIIRKGGLGLPIVFAVAIFIVFHFINTFGKRVAQEDGMTPFMGVWMSSIILTPLAIFLTYRATTDIGAAINFDGILVPFQKLFAKFESKKEIKQPKAIVDIENYKIIEDEEFETLKGYSDDVLVRIVKNSKQFNYSYDYRIKAIKILDGRGITQEQLKAENNLENIDYNTFYENVTAYYSSVKLTLVFYVISLITSLVMNNNRSIWFFLLFGISALLFYISMYLSQKKIDEIGDAIGRKIEPGLAMAFIIGFPFFIFVYLYNNKVLKEAIAEFRS
jgi:lipopolysaccharide export system permease protein